MTASAATTLFPQAILECRISRHSIMTEWKSPLSSHSTWIIREMSPYSGLSGVEASRQGSASTSIRKVEYVPRNQRCTDADLVPEHVGCLDTNFVEYDATAAGHDTSACVTPKNTGVTHWENQILKQVQISQTSGKFTVWIDVPGQFEVRFVDIQGRTSYVSFAEGYRPLIVDGSLFPGGIYKVIVRADGKQVVCGLCAVFKAPKSF